MTLFRMTYLRDGRPRGTTFVGKSPEWATTFAEAWCGTIHVKLLTVKALRPLRQPELRLEP